MTGIAGEPFGASQPAPGGVATDPGPNPIEVGFAPPAKQQRLTVFFRFILLIPQYIVLYVLQIAAEVVAFIGWWGALFMGRLPEWAAEFLTGFLRWYARVTAYGLLLTDKYPPFSFEDADYSLRVATRPGPLNRLAVLFRLILAIPAWIVSAVIAYGAFTLTMFVVWLIVLVRGSMPEALHQALSAVLRYLVRFQGYVLLLTSQYPARLFGDEPAATPAGAFGTGEQTVPEGASWAPGAAPEVTPMATDETVASAFPVDEKPAFPPATDETVTDTPPVDQPSAVPPAASTTWAVPETTSTPGGEVAPEPGAAAAPGPWESSGPAAGWAVPGEPPWRLALSQQARNLVGVFIGLGILFWIGYSVAIGFAVSQQSSVVSRQTAINNTQAHYLTLNRSLLSFAQKTQTCQGNSDVLKCVTDVDRQAAAALDEFATSVSSEAMPASPASASAKASALATSASDTATVFRHLSTATSPTQYQSIILSSNLQGLLGRITANYVSLQDALAHG
ncbi:MAG TPA: DUF4389 domain-containing protein [Streptosporangiaceae bacterium]|nr:DUF4389 domain-containing protein [Streptosporangiaceae bacterium]